jgi:hypothetical protein
MANDKPKDESVQQSSPPSKAGSTVDPARQARWDAFLAKARLLNPERFDAQKANKEFDKIPDKFV